MIQSGNVGFMFITVIPALPMEQILDVLDVVFHFFKMLAKIMMTCMEALNANVDYLNQMAVEQRV